jgi:hypothetical protein
VPITAVAISRERRSAPRPDCQLPYRKLKGRVNDRERSVYMVEKKANKNLKKFLFPA